MLTITAFDFIFDSTLIIISGIWMSFFAKTWPWIDPPPTKILYPVKDMLAQIGLIIGIINMAINLFGVWMYGYSQ